MRTPAGKACRFYYENFHRGRSDQECRLLDRNPDSPAWQPKDCGHCPVPDILRANSSPDLLLEATVRKGILGFNRRVLVTAYCSKHHIDIVDPFVGCPVCASDRPSLEELFGS